MEFSYFRTAMDTVGTIIDFGGVAAMVLGIAFATARYLRDCRSGGDAPLVRYRRDIGRAILLGLEFLVAGDIIRTVVVAPTRENVVVLGAIILIRTFLSFSLQLELEGRWPWQKKEDPRPTPETPGENVHSAQA